MQDLLKELKDRQAQLQDYINQSISINTQKENDLKSHVNNHNALIGAYTELTGTIASLEAKIKEQDEQIPVESSH